MYNGIFTGNKTELPDYINMITYLNFNRFFCHFTCSVGILIEGGRCNIKQSLVVKLLKVMKAMKPKEKFIITNAHVD